MIKEKKKKKLKKGDIGAPIDFKHVTHCGWKGGQGFDYSGDPALKSFFEKAGITENQLKNRHTRDFIYDFIQTNNVEAIVKNEVPPPLPQRNSVDFDLLTLKFKIFFFKNF